MALFRGLGARKDATRGTTPIEVRKVLAGLFSPTTGIGARSGILLGADSPLVTGNATWAYNVGVFHAFVSRAASDGGQVYGNDGSVLIGATGVGTTVPITPAVGLQRIDIIWTRHPTNTENADTTSDPLFGVASGAEAVSAIAPAIPTGAIELARNLMTSAATSTVSAGNTITQTALYTGLRGVPIPVRNQTERDALTLRNGLMVYRLDLFWVEIYNGTTWLVPSPVVNQNYLLNGDMGIWQAGIGAFSSGGVGIYTADRWKFQSPAGSVSQDTTSLPVGAQFGWKYTSPGSNSYMQMGQQIEFKNCKSLQNKQVTVSFNALANNTNAGSTALTIRLRTVAGIDGAVLFAGANIDNAVTISTAQTRYSTTFTLPATFGALSVETVLGAHVSGDGFQISLIKIEVGSVATAFSTATGNLTAELDECKRFCQVYGGTVGYEYIGSGIAASTTQAYVGVDLPVEMRAVPSLTNTGAVGDFTLDAGDNNFPITSAISINAGSSTKKIRLTVAYSAGTLTVTNFYALLTNNTATSKLILRADF